ncbi:MAG: alanyl-tRNA editing protein [Thaumarchaeota archaeon]|nr:MAG: alanyl-tRNA editing protein [Nitrososphaerota archaeon]
MSEAETRAHSALHVLKGAAQKVLATNLTASVYVSGERGRLTVQAVRKPTQEELRRVEEEANAVIREGAEVLEFEMEREEAEKHFGEAIYDLFPVPKEVSLLKIVRIPDWNVNCCREKHVENTSQIGEIHIEGVRFRNSKQLLEISFHLLNR